MAAPIGNLYAIGNTGGAPPYFATPKDLSLKIAEYLEYEDSLKPRDAKTGQGKGVYTIEGCALFCGFATRKSFYDYEKKEEFLYILDRFRLFMTHWNVQKLYWGGTFTGAQFWLKNHGGYVDESTQNQNQIITQVSPTVITNSPPLSNSEKDVDV